MKQYVRADDQGRIILSGDIMGPELAQLGSWNAADAVGRWDMYVKALEELIDYQRGDDITRAHTQALHDLAHFMGMLPGSVVADSVPVAIAEITRLRALAGFS